MDANMDISVDYSVLDAGVSAIKDIKGRCSDLISALSSVDVSILESGYLLTQAVSTVEEIMSGSVEEVLRNIIDVETLFYMFQNQDFFTRLQEELKNGTFNDENNNHDIEKIMEYMIANSDGRYQDLLKDEDFRRLFIMQNLLSSYGITSMRDLNAFRDVCFLKVRTYEEEADKLKYSPARLTQEFMNIINARYRGSYGKGLSNVADTTIMAYSYVDSNGNQILTDSLDNIPKDKKREAKGLSYTDLCGDSEEYRKLMDISSGIKSIAMLGPGSDFSKFREELSTQIKEDDARLKEIDEILNDQDNSDDVIGYRTQLTLIDGIRQDVISRTDHLTKLYGYMLNDDFKEMSNENYKEISSAVNDLKEKASSLAIWGRGGDTSIYAPIDEGDETNLVLYSLISDNEEFIVDPFGGICYSEGGKLYTLLNPDDTLSNYSRWAPVMTEDEKKCFYYIWNKEGSDKSYEYLQDISDVLDNRWVEQQSLADSSFALEHKCAASVFSIVSNPVNGLSTLLYSFQQWANDKEMRKTQLYSPGDVMRGAISQELTEESAVKGFFYNVGMSIGDNLYSMLLSGGNSTLSGMFLGFGAYDDNLNDALSRGLSDEDAIKYAGAMATVECITESVSIENLLNIKPVKAIVDIPVDDVVELSGGKKIVKDVLQPLDTINNAADDIFSETVLKNLDKFTNPTARKCAYYASNIVYQGLKQGLGEGNEEVASAILGRWADDWISDENSSYLKEIEGYLDLGYNEVDAIAMANKNFKSEMGQSFLAGFCSGDIMGSGKVTIGLVSADVSADNILKEFYDPTYHADLKEARANMREGNYPALFSQILNDTSVPIEQRIADANKIVDAMEERGLITKEGHDQLAGFVNDYDSAKVLTDHLIDGGAADFKESLESIQEDSSLETDLELSSDTDLRQDDRNVHEVVSESNERDSIHFETETDVNTSDNSKTGPLLKSETQNDSVDTNDKINGDSLVEKRKNSTDSIDQRQNMDETIQKDTSLEIDFQQANDLHKVDAVIKNDINMDSQTADSVISPKVQEQGIDTAIKAAQVAFDVSSVEDIENSPIGVEKVDTRVQSVQNKELTLSEVAAKQAFDPSQHRESIVSNHQKINNDLMQSTEDKTSFGARNADSMALADDIGIAKISSTAAAIAMLGVDTDNQNSSNLYSNERITIDGESDSSYDGDTFSSKDSALAQKKLSDGEYELEDGESLSDYHIGIQFFAEPKTNSGTIRDGIDLNTDNVTVTDNFESDTGINISKPRNIIVDGKNYVVNFFSGIKDFIVAKSTESKITKAIRERGNITNIIDSTPNNVLRFVSSKVLINAVETGRYKFSDNTPSIIKSNLDVIIAEHKYNARRTGLLSYLDCRNLDFSIFSPEGLKKIADYCENRRVGVDFSSSRASQTTFADYILNNYEQYPRLTSEAIYYCSQDIFNQYLEIIPSILKGDEFLTKCPNSVEVANVIVGNPKQYSAKMVARCVNFSDISNFTKSQLPDLVAVLKETGYIITEDSPSILKSQPDIIVASIENIVSNNSDYYFKSSVSFKIDNLFKIADLSGLTDVELGKIIPLIEEGGYRFYGDTPNILSNFIVNNSKTYSDYVYGAMESCDQEILSDYLAREKPNPDAIVGRILNSKNRMIAADYVIRNSNAFNDVIIAIQSCSTDAFTENIEKIVSLFNKVGVIFDFHNQIQNNIFYDYVLHNPGQYPSILRDDRFINCCPSQLLTGNVLEQFVPLLDSSYYGYRFEGKNEKIIADYVVQHPNLNPPILHTALNLCDSTLLTDNILENAVPLLSGYYSFEGENGKRVANYLVQRPDLNSKILHSALGLCDFTLLTDNILENAVPLLSGYYSFEGDNGKIIADYVVQHPNLNPFILHTALNLCDSTLLTNNILEQAVPLLLGYSFEGDNGKIIADYVVQHPDLNNQILVEAMNCCDFTLLTDSFLEQVVPLLLGYSFEGENGKRVANYLVQRPDLNSKILHSALGLCDFTLLTDNILENAVPLLSGYYSFEGDNGKIIADYVVQHPDLNNQILVEAMNCCDFTLLTDSFLEQVVPLLSSFYRFDGEKGKRVANYLIQHQELNLALLEQSIIVCDPSLLTISILEKIEENGFHLSLFSGFDALNIRFKPLVDLQLSSLNESYRGQLNAVIDILGCAPLATEGYDGIFSSDFISAFGIDNVCNIYKYVCLTGVEVDFKKIVAEYSVQDFKKLYDVIFDSSRIDADFDIVYFKNLVDKYVVSPSLFEEIINNGVSAQDVLLLKKYIRSNFDINVNTYEELQNYDTLLQEHISKVLENNNIDEVKNIDSLLLFNRSNSDMTDFLYHIADSERLRTLASRLDSVQTRETLEGYAVLLEFFEDKIIKNNDINQVKKIVEKINSMPVDDRNSILRLYEDLDRTIKYYYGLEVNKSLTKLSEIVEVNGRETGKYLGTKYSINDEAESTDVPVDYIEINSNYRFLQHTLNAYGGGGRLIYFLKPKIVGRSYICLSMIGDNKVGALRAPTDIDHVSLLFDCITAKDLVLLGAEDLSSYTILPNDLNVKVYDGRSGRVIFDIVDNVLNKTPISYHNEYVVYRDGAHPSGILVTGDVPNQAEIDAAATLGVPLVKINHNSNDSTRTMNLVPDVSSEYVESVHDVIGYLEGDKDYSVVRESINGKIKDDGSFHIGTQFFAESKTDGSVGVENNSDIVSIHAGVDTDLATLGVDIDSYDSNEQDFADRESIKSNDLALDQKKLLDSGYELEEGESLAGRIGTQFFANTLENVNGCDGGNVENTNVAFQEIATDVDDGFTVTADNSNFETDSVNMSKSSLVDPAIAMLGVDTDNQNSSNLYSNEQIVIDGESESSYDGDTQVHSDGETTVDGEFELKEGESLAGRIGTQFFGESKTNSGDSVTGIANTLNQACEEAIANEESYINISPEVSLAIKNLDIEQTADLLRKVINNFYSVNLVLNHLSSTKFKDVIQSIINSSDGRDILSKQTVAFSTKMPTNFYTDVDFMKSYFDCIDNKSLSLILRMDDSHSNKTRYVSAIEIIGEIRLDSMISDGTLISTLSGSAVVEIFRKYADNQTLITHLFNNLTQFQYMTVYNEYFSDGFTGDIISAVLENAFNSNLSNKEIGNLLEAIYNTNNPASVDFVNGVISDLGTEKIKEMISDGTLSYNSQFSPFITRIFQKQINQEKDGFLHSLGGQYGVDQNAVGRNIRYSVAKPWVTNLKDFANFIKNNYKCDSVTAYLEAVRLNTPFINMDLRDVKLINKYLASDDSKSIKDVLDFERNILKRTGNSSYRQLFNEFSVKCVDDATATKILECIDTTGACSYAAFANVIANSYKNDPEGFKRDFGFDLYIEVDGKKQINSQRLMLDMYVFINSIENGGVLFWERHDGKIALVGKRIDTEKQMYVSSKTFYNDCAVKYLKSKNPELTIKSSQSIDATNMSIVELKNAVGKALQSGYQLGMYVGRDLEHVIPFKDEFGVEYTTTANWEEDGAHAVYVTGITDTSVIVSSWGKRLMLPFEALANNPEVAFRVSKLDTTGEGKVFIDDGSIVVPLATDTTIRDGKTVTVNETFVDSNNRYDTRYLMEKPVKDIDNSNLNTKDGPIMFSKNFSDSLKQMSVYFGDAGLNNFDFGIKIRDMFLDGKTTNEILDDLVDKIEVSEFNDFLKTRQGKFLSQLDSEQIKAFSIYSRLGAGTINEQLRLTDGDIDSIFELIEGEFVSDLVQLIDDSMELYGGLDEDIILYRGISVNSFFGQTSALNKMFSSLKQNNLENNLFVLSKNLEALIGEELNDYAYMSTSPGYRTSFAELDRCPIVMEIMAPTGTQGAYINQISSSYNRENEFLLARGTKLIIEGVALKEDVNGKIKIFVRCNVVK